MITPKKTLVSGTKLSFYCSDKKGPVIVLLHGWGASKEKLLPLGKVLHKNRWQVFIPDLPGFGRSGLPPRPWGVSEYANFIFGAINKLYKEEKVYIFGHSFGGRLAIELSRVYPKKIAGLVLCGSAGISRGSFVKRLFFLILAKIGRVVFPRSTSLRRLIYKLAREHDYEKTEGVMRETFRLVVRQNLKPLLLKIKTPTLILWGKKDKMTKYSDAQIISSKVEGSQLIFFPGVGHRLPYEKPELLATRMTEWRKSQ